MSSLLSLSLFTLITNIDFQDEKEKKSPDKIITNNKGENEGDEEEEEENNYDDYDEEDEMNDFIVADEGDGEEEEGEGSNQNRVEKMFKRPERPRQTRRDRDITGAPTSGKLIIVFKRSLEDHFLNLLFILFYMYICLCV